MIKDGWAKPNRTKCDFCDKPAVVAKGSYFVCEQHTARANEKRAAVISSLKTAGIDFADYHSKA